VFLTGFLLHDVVIQALKGTQHLTCGEIGHNPLADGETKHIPCRPGTVGSVIKVTRKASDSTGIVLCEVEVYGTQGKIPILNII